MYANPDRHTKTFNLDHVSKHGYIEHDGSLSRGDAAFGEATEFSQEAFDEVLAKFREAHPGKSDDEIETDWQTAARARWVRVMKSKERCDGAGKDWLFGLREAIMSFGETSLYLNLLGKDGVAPLRWVRIFFGKYPNSVMLDDDLQMMQKRSDYHTRRVGDHRRSSINLISTMAMQR